MNPIVEFKNVSKTFYTKNGPFQALNQINLAIQEGDIFGIIGLSGPVYQLSGSTDRGRSTDCRTRSWKNESEGTAETEAGNRDDFSEF